MLTFFLLMHLSVRHPQVVAAKDISGDRLLEQVVQQYREDSVLDPWDGSWMPGQGLTRGGYVVAASGDARMSEILAVLTRERLDAGGWINPYVSGPGYTAEYALLRAPIGQEAPAP